MILNAQLTVGNSKLGTLLMQQCVVLVSKSQEGVTTCNGDVPICKVERPSGCMRLIGMMLDQLRSPQIVSDSYREGDL